MEQRGQVIDVHVLVLAGDRDRIVALDLSVALYRALPRAALGVCPQADHAGPTAPERADAFAQFIAGLGRRHPSPRGQRPRLTA